MTCAKGTAVGCRISSRAKAEYPFNATAFNGDASPQLSSHKYLTSESGMDGVIAYTADDTAIPVTNPNTLDTSQRRKLHRRSDNLLPELVA
jgi:hypothetical protein